MVLINIFLQFLIIKTIHSLVLPDDQTMVCQNGKSQSPISVDLSQTNYVSYPPFVLSDGYREPMVFNMLNHHNETISIIPLLASPKSLVISGGCLSGVFTFQSAHLHWPQSEHKFIHNNYVAEAHFIHKNLQTNETAVFAYFFTMAGNQSQETGDEMNSWEGVLPKVTSSTNMTLENGLASLMRGKINRFVHYAGSLTTSPCTEGVTWILVSSNIKLRESSLNHLRTNIITSNYRATQPLNGRIVRRSFPSIWWNI